MLESSVFPQRWGSTGLVSLGTSAAWPQCLSPSNSEERRLEAAQKRMLGRAEPPPGPQACCALHAVTHQSSAHQSPSHRSESPCVKCTGAQAPRTTFCSGAAGWQGWDRQSNSLGRLGPFLLLYSDHTTDFISSKGKRCPKNKNQSLNGLQGWTRITLQKEGEGINADEHLICPELLLGTFWQDQNLRKYQTNENAEVSWSE